MGKIKDRFAAITAGEFFLLQELDNLPAALAALVFLKIESRGAAVVRISQGEMARSTQMSRNTLRKALEALERIGLIRQRSGARGGKIMANHYEIISCSPGEHSCSSGEQPSCSSGEHSCSSGEQPIRIERTGINEIGIEGDRLIKTMLNNGIQRRVIEALVLDMLDVGIDLARYKEIYTAAAEKVLGGKTRNSRGLDKSQLTQALVNSINAYTVGTIRQIISKERAWKLPRNYIRV